MKNLYKLNKEDVRELLTILNNAQEIEIDYSGWTTITKDGKEYRGCRVFIDNEKTCFTWKLKDFLIEKGVIEKA